MKTDQEYFQFYNGDKMGMKTLDGSIVVPAKYDFVSPFSDGVFMVKDGNKSSYQDTKGKLLFPLDNRYEIYCDFSEGLAPVYTGTEYGYIDKSGKEVIAPQFVFAEGFSEGLAVVRNDKDLHAVLDKKGNLIIDFKYKFIADFNNGYANFGDFSLWGIIDAKGNEVVAQIYPFLGTVEDGKVIVQVDDNGEYKEGVLTIATNEIEWNNNLDAVNEFNQQRNDLFDKLGKLIADFYEDGCPCERARFRDYVQSSGNIRKMDQELLFDAFAAFLETSDNYEYKCSCGTTYQMDHKELNAFFGVQQVRILKKNYSDEKGSQVTMPIPVSLGLQALDLSELEDIYIQKDNDAVIAYLRG
ncbi:WG repeat-containing protein [bacterium]|nr:WG repeat-containing protein [bacterium]